MPLIRFRLESFDIESLNGSYEQGHTINLTKSVIELDYQFSLYIDNISRVDLDRYYISGNDNNIIEVVIDEENPVDYFNFAFRQTPSTFNMSFYIFDKFIGEYIELINLIKQ